LNYFNINIYIILYKLIILNFFNIKIFLISLKWGLGIGDWGLGIGDWGLGPIPHPQTPNPKKKNKKILNLNLIYF